MKSWIKPLVILAMLPLAAQADTKIGVTLSSFDNNFLTMVRHAMAEEGKSTKGIELQFEDAQNDVGRQISQVQNFVAQKVGAIIVNAVDTSATKRITDGARAAGIPVVYVNLKPDEKLGNGAYYIGSDSVLAGRLQMEALAKRMQGKGTVAIMEGNLSHEASLERTRGVKEVAARYPGIKVTEVQTANWERGQAINLMRKWLSAGHKFDAVAANNDEMALGAAIALKQAGVPPTRTLVAGVDATQDGLSAMSRGELALTVFQDAGGQGKGAVKLAVQAMSGSKSLAVETWVPYQVVTPENYKQFLSK